VKRDDYQSLGAFAAATVEEVPERVHDVGEVDLRAGDQNAGNVPVGVRVVICEDAFVYLFEFFLEQKGIESGSTHVHVGVYGLNDLLKIEVLL
jgi:hypothetical protein